MVATGDVFGMQSDAPVTRLNGKREAEASSRPGAAILRKASKPSPWLVPASLGFIPGGLHRCLIRLARWA